MIKFLLSVAALGIVALNLSVPRTIETELPRPQIQAVSNEQDLDALAVEAMYKELYSGVSDYEMLDENACIEGCEK